MLAYNCSPSFNWKKNLDDATIAKFQRELGAMGYKFQFITLAGFHSLNYSMFNLAYGYARNQMSAFVELQEAEFAAAERGFTAVKHQREVGTGYFDAVTTTIEREASTAALKGSTEDEQFAWSLVVYAPVAHWVWGPGGWLAQLGALDFAGGTVVHLNAGVAGLVAAWWLKPRLGHGQVALRPANLGYTLIGASLLWVGWIGFNGGSAGAANGQAGMAFLATQLAAAAGTLAWMGAEWLVRRTPTLLGMCSGALAGLVAVTPASGYVTPASAVLIGTVAGIGCLWGATGLKAWLGVDDALDVFGVHAVGGLIGALLTGVLADPGMGGATGSAWTQALACVATMAYSGCATALVLWLVSQLLALRVTPEQETQGLDWSQHAERLE
jgi:ammonium transporter